MNGDQVLAVLLDLGYKPNLRNKWYRCRAIYRDGSKNTSLSVHSENGFWTDFVTGQSGSFEDLIALTLGKRKGDLEVVNYLKKHGLNTGATKEVETYQQKKRVKKVYDKSILNRLLPHFDYFLEKGISEDTLKLFDCGLATNGSMLNRLVFPIFDISTNKIIGFSGRYVKKLDENRAKWKIIGSKYDFIYPYHLNKNFIKDSKTVILVEGISDVLWLWDNNIKNVLCLFGISISSKMICHLTSLGLENIVIATNNEDSGVGNIASEKIKNKLSKLFDLHKIHIFLPYKKDFHEMSQEEIAEWKKELDIKLKT